MHKYKGIDDLVASGNQPDRVKGTAIPALFQTIRCRLFGVSPGEQPALEPAAVSQTERPSFPVEVFPAPVANFARKVAGAMSCPIDFVGLGILVTGGAAIGAARSIKVKGGWFEKPGLYSVIVSRPGTTKTPALKAVMQPIYEAQDKLNEDHKAALKKYEKDLEAFKNAKQKPPEGEPAPQPPHGKRTSIA